MRIVRRCTSAETSALADYLAGTAVSDYVARLHADEVIASLGEAGSAELAALWSIFGNLGPFYARDTVGRPKYVVSEVHDAWTRAAAHDPVEYKKLLVLIEAERRGSLTDRLITVAQTKAGAVIIDGNKRAVAIYEVTAPAVLPVYLIESAPGWPILPMP